MLIETRGFKIEATQGDIAKQPDMVAIVNAANAELRSGGGVAGAIHNAAGPKLAEECQPLAPIKPGQAVITSGYQLPNQYVIHCLGPIYGIDQPEAYLLANCYRNVLKLADSKKISSIAIPAISAGVFSYPIELATEVALRTVNQTLAALHHIKHIRFVLFSEQDLLIYERKLVEIFV